MSAPRSSEAHFQTQVEQLAKFYGWRVFHAPDNRPSGTTGRVQRVTPGFPDLVLVRPPEIIFAELKGPKTRVTSAQRDWLQDFAEVGTEARFTADAAAAAGHHTSLAVDAYLWRPCDFDEIHSRLARGRNRVEPIYRAGAA